MEETNFILLWKEHYTKIEQSLQINKKLLRETIDQKAMRSMRSLYATKITGIVLGIIYLFILGTFLSFALINFTSAALYFIVSMGAIFLINLKAVFDYIKHINWVNNIDFSGNVSDIQTKLAKLKLSIFQHCRTMTLQLPFWTTFFLSDKWFPGEVGWGYILFQIFITGSFTFTAIWIYRQLTIENGHKKWVRALIAGSGGKSVNKALEFYGELEEFKG